MKRLVAGGVAMFVGLTACGGADEVGSEPVQGLLCVEITPELECSEYETVQLSEEDAQAAADVLEELIGLSKDAPSKIEDAKELAERFRARHGADGPIPVPRLTPSQIDAPSLTPAQVRAVAKAIRALN